MKKIIVMLLLCFTTLAHAGVFYYGDNEAVNLTDKVKFASGQNIITGDTDDPSAVSKDATIGSIYQRSTTGELYVKLDNGDSTNWAKVPDTVNAQTFASSVTITGTTTVTGGLYDGNTTALIPLAEAGSTDLSGFTATSILGALDELNVGGSSFSDTDFDVHDDGDDTKVMQFELSGVTAGSTSTLTVPDNDGTIALTNVNNNFSSKQTFSEQVTVDSTVSIYDPDGTDGELLNGTGFNVANKWDVTNGFSITGGAALFVEGGSGGTLTQITASTAQTYIPDLKMLVLTYEVSDKTFAGTGTAYINASWGPEKNIPMTLNVGTNTVKFYTGTAYLYSGFRITVSSTNPTDTLKIDNISLKEYITGVLSVPDLYVRRVKAEIGDRNIAIGSNAMTSIGSDGTSHRNIGIGYNSLAAMTTGSYYNTMVGSNTGSGGTSGFYGNTGIGYQALYNVSTGSSYNTALGYRALESVSTGALYNTGFGMSSGDEISTGDYNTCLGGITCRALTTESNNTMIGYYAGRYSTGANGLFIGYRAGFNQTTATSLILIDNQARDSAANEATQSMIYAMGDVDGRLDQTMAINAHLTAEGSGIVGLTEKSIYSKGEASYADLADFTSGSNAAFDGGGSSSSEFTYTTTATDLINGARAFRFTAAALNDYVASTVIPVPQGYRGQKFELILTYFYNGNDDDISWNVHDDTNGTSLSETLLDKYTDPAENSKNQVRIVFDVPTSCENIKVGPQVETLTAGREFIWDAVVIRNIGEGEYVNVQGATAGDVVYYDGTSWERLAIGTASQVLTSNGTIPTWADSSGGGGGSVSVDATQMIVYNGAAGYSSTNTSIPYFTSATTNTATDTLVTISNSSTTGFSITPKTDVIINLSTTCDYTGDGFVGFTMNSTQLSNTIYGQTDLTTVLCAAGTTDSDGSKIFSCSVQIFATASDVIRPHYDGNNTAGSWGGLCSVNIMVWGI